MATIEDVYAAFEGLDWEERYRLVIGLGRDLPPLPEEAREGTNLVSGCQSQVWLIARPEDGVVRFRADSDSGIVRGLIAILLMLFDGRSPKDILTTDAHAVFTRLGLDRHLSATRQNGFRAMVQRIQQLAVSAA